MLNRFAIGLSALVAVTGVSSAGLSDFYVSTDRDGLYLVDGETFQAERVADLPTGGGYRDGGIGYGGGGTMYVNALSQGFFTLDLASGISTALEYEIEGGSGGAGLPIRQLSVRPDGSLYTFRPIVVPGQGLIASGLVIDPEHGTASYRPSVSGLGFASIRSISHISMSEAIVVDSLTGYHLLNTETGESTLIADFPDEPELVPTVVLAMGDRIIMSTTRGVLYEFDKIDGSLMEIGSISGIEPEFGDEFITAMTIPAPSAAVVLGMAGLIGVRRRR